MTEEENQVTMEHLSLQRNSSGLQESFVQLALEIRPQLALLLARVHASALTCVHLSSEEVENQVMLTLIRPECSGTALISSKMSYFSPRVGSNWSYYSDLIFGFVKVFGSHSDTAEIQRIFGSTPW